MEFRLNTFLCSRKYSQKFSSILSFANYNSYFSLYRVPFTVARSHSHIITQAYVIFMPFVLCWLCVVSVVRRSLPVNSVHKFHKNCVWVPHLFIGVYFMYSICLACTKLWSNIWNRTSTKKCCSHAHTYWHMRMRRIHNHRCRSFAFSTEMKRWKSEHDEKKRKKKKESETILKPTAKPHFLCVCVCLMCARVLYVHREYAVPIYIELPVHAIGIFINYVEYVFHSVWSSALVHHSIDHIENDGDARWRPPQRHTMVYGDDGVTSIAAATTKYIFSFMKKKMIVCSFHFIRSIRFASL